MIVENDWHWKELNKLKGIIYESELKVLEILWKEEEIVAKELAQRLQETTGWSKTTSYTVVKRMVEKGLIERAGHHYLCRALLSEEEAKENEIKALVDKMFHGCEDALLASLLGIKKITPSQIEILRGIVKEFTPQEALNYPEKYPEKAHSQPELKLLKLLWTVGKMTVGELMTRFEKTENWDETQTLDLIKNCVEMGFIRKSTPKFMCYPVMTLEEATRKINHFSRKQDAPTVSSLSVSRETLAFS